jgi:glyoxylase-like metal-dependent hydrolase (beta-lactamase superfamily II)
VWCCSTRRRPSGTTCSRAVDEITAAENVPNAVTHLVYSHHRADHAGAANLFGDALQSLPGSIASS